MKITKENLGNAVKNNILSADQADELMAFLKSQPTVAPAFDFTHVLYYFGGLIAIAAMTLFMTLGWKSFGGWGIFFISLIYAGVGLKLTNSFQNKGYAVPAGICVAFVVALTPLAIYGLQQALGLWPDETKYSDYHRYIKWHWIYLELGTLAAGAAAAWRYKYPFLIMPIAVTLWYMSMDLAVMIFGDDISWTLRKLVSMYSGILIIGLAFWIDVRARKTTDYAFWLYIFGVMAFWGGLSMQYSDSEFAKFIYFTINIFMIGIGVLLVRRVFVVFGGIGCCGYLGHLAFSVFKDSWLFPITLTAIGLLIVYLGVVWQKNEAVITEKARKFLPSQIKELLESKIV